MKKIIAGTSAIALSLSMTSVAFAAGDTGNIQLEVEVMDTLSMDCYDSADTVAPFDDTTVTLTNSSAGAGMVVAGAPAVGKSKCVVTTNDDNGYHLAIDNTSNTYTHVAPSGTGISTATTVLSHENPNVDGEWYDLPDLNNTWTVASEEGNASVWNSRKGLGFSVIDYPEDDAGDLLNNTLADEWVVAGSLCTEHVTADDALYAAVPAASTDIAAVTSYDANATTTEVCYKVDVAATQESGDYAGQVTFTATSDASVYYN